MEMRMRKKFDTVGFRYGDEDDFIFRD